MGLRQSRFGPRAAWRWLLVAWIALGIGRIGIVEARAAAPDPAKIMEKVARDLGLQTKMPVEDEPKRDERPWSNTRWHIPGNVAQWVLWGALAVGLGFAVYAMRDTIPGLSKRTKVKPRGVVVVLPSAESIERMNEAGDDADELARRGLIAEAMHMLLLRSVGELRKRLDVTIADSLTSREILARLALPDLGRRALADLIGRVERVHFGSQVPAPADYGACRASFEALVDAMRGPATAPA